MSERSSLERMLEARSVAIVGASVREGTVGHQAMVELVEGGFEGAIHPVNPKYGEVLGLGCCASVAELGEPVDLVILAVSNALLEEQLRLAASAGAGSAVIFASGYEAPREGVPPLTERLAAIAREAGMALCGGNGMGFANFEKRVRALGFYEPKDVKLGGITFVSHSGSAFSAVIHNRRGLGLNLAVSSGQELVTTTADYLRYALGLDSTRVIGLFIETVRDPAGFVEAMRLRRGAGRAGRRAEGRARDAHAADGRGALGRARRRGRRVRGAVRGLRRAPRREPGRDGGHARAVRVGAPGRPGRAREHPRLGRRARAARRLGRGRGRPARADLGGDLGADGGAAGRGPARRQPARLLGDRAATRTRS